MLSYFMLVELNEVSPSLVEYITWVWLATMIIEEIRQVSPVGCFWTAKRFE